jgi:hypothetical protein
VSELYVERGNESKEYIKKYTPIMNQIYKGKTLTELLDGFLEKGEKIPDINTVGSYKTAVLSYNDMWTQGAYCSGSSFGTSSATAFGNIGYASGYGSNFTSSFVSCSPEKNYNLDCSFTFAFDKKTEKFAFVTIKGNGCQLPPKDKAEYDKKIKEQEENIIKPYFVKVGIGVDNTKITGILDGKNAVNGKDIEKKYSLKSFVLDIGYGKHINKNLDLYFGFKLNPTKLDKPTGYYTNGCYNTINYIDFYYNHLFEYYVGLGFGTENFKVNFDVGFSYPDASYHFFCTGTQKSDGGGGGLSTSFEIRPEFYFGKRNQYSIALYYQVFSRVTGENEFASDDEQIKMSFDVIKYGLKYNYYFGMN